MKARIPKKIISYIEINKSKDYSWNIDKTVPLEKQELLPTTKEILTVLYKDYICTDIERIELEKTLNENEVNYQNELREKYNPDNLFRNKQKEVENVKTDTGRRDRLKICCQQWRVGSSPTTGTRTKEHSFMLCSYYIK